MYIGIISDTHCWFDDPLKKFLEPVDEIWHAGDFGNEETLLQIADFKPLKGVYGNCDGTQVRGRVPYTQFFECGGKRVLMMHIGGYPGRYDYKAFQLINAHLPDIFVCGHSHILKVIFDKKYNMLTCSPSIQVQPASPASTRYAPPSASTSTTEIFTAWKSVNGHDLSNNFYIYIHFLKQLSTL